MFDQVFSLTDLPKLFFLAFLEIILSTDNAIVIGLLAARLPEKLRSKALYIGLVSAFFIRALTVILLSFFIKYRWVQILGAGYLLFLAGQYFVREKKPIPDDLQKRSLWKAIALIELFDVIFAFDSILAAVAFVSSNNPQEFHSKIWIVYVGGMIGLIGIRFAAHIFTKFISKFPNMERSAHLLIGWIGIKLIYELFHYPLLFDYCYWTVFMIILLYGFWKR
jgi:YkoY family integral membrane protein